MLVNLTDLFTAEGKVEEVQIPLEMTSFCSRLGNFSILEKSPVSLILSNAGTGKVRIEGSAELTFRTRCDRCLSDVPTKLELKFHQVVASPDAGKDEEEEENPSYLEGYQLNVESFVHDEILMNWPMKILCREDCKGVCPVCGKNRNDGDCGCDTFVPDPRMAAIQDIFNANKEV